MDVSAARANLMRALSRAGLPARWRERCLDDEGVPAHVRGFGSPTIFVDGVDVSVTESGAQVSAAVPATSETGRVHVPPVGLLVSALGGERSGAAPAPVPPAPAMALVPTGALTLSRSSRATSRNPRAGRRTGWRRVVATLPSVGVALLPKVACLACWPAYSGPLSSLGVSFLIDARYLLALTAAFLAVALFLLGFRARRRRGYRPLALGIVASILLLYGKFELDSDPVMFAGVGALMAASLWSSWPRRAAVGARCPSCEPAASAGSRCAPV